MTLACMQPCLEKMGTEPDYYNGKELWPRNKQERNKVLYLFNNHFCLISKSEGVSFSKALDELPAKIKFADDYISNNNVIGYSN